MSVQVVFKALTGESLAEISVDRSSTIASIRSLLADRVPLPPKKSYQLVLGTDLLPADDTLKSHVDGEATEIIAAVQSDDSSDESSGNSSKNKKQSKDKKKKAKDKKTKKDKKKDGKDKKKKGKDKKKKGKSSSDSSSAPKKKKSKKDKETEEEVAAKNEWVSQRLDQLRQMKPPMPMEQCLVRAQKEWLEHKKKLAEESEANRMKDWPPMVHEAKQQAEEEARNAGKSEAEVKAEGEKAAGFALKVAKDNGLYKDPNDKMDDQKNVPLFFQKRKGLEKAISYLEKS